MVQHYNASQVELSSQRVTYGWGLGRLAAATFANETAGSPEQFTYSYTYNQPGRLVTQRMQLHSGNATVNLDATYEWDNEGKMTSMVPPGGGIGGGTPMGIEAKAAPRRKAVIIRNEMSRKPEAATPATIRAHPACRTNPRPVKNRHAPARVSTAATT
jgi:hypothetical protein